MPTLEPFGTYVLLKKLGQDALGETFRAGRLGQPGLEQVVLLRVLNGDGIDGKRLTDQLSRQNGIQQVLKSPNIGNGVDLGDVHGLPYVAYDYISGRNLGDLFEQSERRGSPIPPDHALLIAERLALALAVAYETRLQGKRILHGFLVPHLVMLSNEGENRLLGFEVAPGLREFASWEPLQREFGRYLSPEALAGAPPSKTDDIYALGAILLELLLGRRLPYPSDDNYASLIAQIKMAPEGTRIWPEIRQLLERSLIPSGESISDVVTWHRALSRLMIEGQYNATPFNLAFFMHNLFRDEIEQESRELEVEQNIKIAEDAKPAESAAREPPVPGRLAPPSPVSTLPLERRPLARLPGPPQWRRQALNLAQVVALGLLVLLAGYAGWRYRRSIDRSRGEGASLTPVTQPAAPDLAETTDLPPPAGPQPEELLAEIDKIVDERTKAMEESLRLEYDRRIRSLQRQLEEARQAQLARQQAATPTPQIQSQGAPPSTGGQSPMPRPPQSTPQNRGEGSAAQAGLAAGNGPPSPGQNDAGAAISRALVITPQAAATRERASPTPQPGSATTPGGTSTAATPARTDAPAHDTGPASPTRQDNAPAAGGTRAATAPATTASPGDGAKSRQPRVRLGDLVKAGPEVESPRLLSRLEPRYPGMARKLKQEATVLIAVLVDENGTVLEAESRTPIDRYGFEQEALRAARMAKFSPAKKKGVRVKMWTSLRIHFKLEE